MYYQSNNYKSFESLSNLLSSVNRLLAKEFPNQPQFKVYKEKLENYYGAKYNAQLVSVNNLTALDSFIQDNFLYNDFKSSYLPISLEHITAKTTLNSLIYDGIKNKTKNLPDNEKLQVWAEIISYVFLCSMNNQSITIQTDSPLDDKNPITQKMEKVFTHISYNGKLLVENNSYAKSKSKEFNNYTNNFDWQVDKTLIDGSWKNSTYVLKQLDKNLLDLNLVEPILFENSEFNENLLKIVFNKLNSNKREDYTIDERLGVDQEIYKKYLYPLFEKINDYADTNFIKDNVAHLFNILSTNKKIIRTKSPSNVEQYIKNYINNIEKSEKINIKSVFKYLNYIEPENLLKPQVLDFIYKNKSYDECLLSEAIRLFPKMDIKSLFFNIIEHDNDTEISFNSFYTKQLKTIVRQCDEQEIIKIFNLSPQILNSYLYQGYRLSFPINDLFLDQILNICTNDTTSTKIHYIDNLFNDNYISKNYKQIFNLELDWPKTYHQLRNSLIKYTCQDPIYLEEKLKTRNAPRELQQMAFNSEFLFPKKKENFNIDKLFYFDFTFVKKQLEDTRLLNQLKDALSLLNTEDTKKLLSNNIKYYTLLPQKYKLDADFAEKFFTSLTERDNPKNDHLVNINAIPSVMFKNINMSFMAVKKYLSYNDCASKENELYINKIPTHYWSNKDFILQLCTIMDKSIKEKVDSFINFMPDKVKIFFKQFKIEHGHYAEFLSSYMEKQELKAKLLNTPIIDNKKVLKL